MKYLNAKERDYIKTIFKDHEPRNCKSEVFLEEVTNNYEKFSSDISSSFSTYESEVGKDLANSNEWLRLALIAIKEMYAFEFPFSESIKKMDLSEFLEFCKEHII